MGPLGCEPSRPAFSRFVALNPEAGDEHGSLDRVDWEEAAAISARLGGSLVNMSHFKESVFVLGIVEWGKDREVDPDFGELDAVMMPPFVVSGQVLCKRRSKRAHPSSAFVCLAEGD